MPHPLTVATLSGLALIGTSGGILLGRSAISEINPIYFTERESRFHTDLGPRPYSPIDAPVVRAGALSAAELDQALGTGCIGCRAVRAEYYPVHRSDESGYSSGWAAMDETPVAPVVLRVEPAPSEAELAERAAADAAHQAAMVEVHRYSSFEVETPALAEMPATQLASAELPAQE